MEAIITINKRLELSTLRHPELGPRVRPLLGYIAPEFGGTLIKLMKRG